MTTGGGGGVLLTDDRALWRKAWSFKDHGKNPDLALERREQGGFRWLHDDFGTNWRMTGMQAAIGLRQLEKLDVWIDIRNRHAKRLNDGLKEVLGIRLTLPEDVIRHAYYKYYCFVKTDLLEDGWDRDRVIDAIRAEGIPCGSGSCSEVYREKAFSHTDFAPNDTLPIARELGETSIMFMVHPTLKDSDIDDMLFVVRKVMNIATG